MTSLDAAQGLSVLAHRQFESAYQIFYRTVQKEQLMCSIYDCFDEPGSQDHNCLGCNFDDMTDWILNFLRTCRDGTTPYLPQQSFATHALLLSLLWERISDIFDILGTPDGYRVRHFEAFIRARKWANFFKHPKAFAWMVHHPEYTFEGSPHSASFSDDSLYLKIDDEFVRRYYASEKAKGLTSRFAGWENKAVVILPDLEVLTTGICASLEKFIKIITESMAYKEILDDRSTFVDYFSQQDL